MPGIAFIKSDDFKEWFDTQELVYASQTRDDNQHIRFTVSRLSDPIYEVTRRDVDTLNRKQLYRGSKIDTAVRTYNDAITPK